MKTREKARDDVVDVQSTISICSSAWMANTYSGDHGCRQFRHIVHCDWRATSELAATKKAEVGKTQQQQCGYLQYLLEIGFQCVVRISRDRLRSHAHLLNRCLMRFENRLVLITSQMDCRGFRPSQMCILLWMIIKWALMIDRKGGGREREKWTYHTVKRPSSHPQRRAVCRPLDTWEWETNKTNNLFRMWRQAD